MLCYQTLKATGPFSFVEAAVETLGGEHLFSCQSPVLVLYGMYIYTRYIPRLYQNYGIAGSLLGRQYIFSRSEPSDWT